MERLTGGMSPGLASGLHGVRMLRPISLYEQARKMEDEWAGLDDKLRDKENDPNYHLHDALLLDELQTEREELDRMKPWEMPEGWRPELKHRAKDRSTFYKGWTPASGSAVGGASKEKVGYLKEDRRCVIESDTERPERAMLILRLEQTERSCQPSRNKGLPSTRSVAQVS